MAWTLKRTTQCAKCPWRKTTNPRDIPNGYSEEKHRALKKTIAEPGAIHAIFSNEPKRAMACHEDDAAHCIGWLMNQLGPGNNIGLRLSVRSCTNIRLAKVVGEQHETFADTL